MEKILPLIFGASDEERTTLTSGLNFMSIPMCNTISGVWVWPEDKKDHFDEKCVAHCHRENGVICILRGDVSEKNLFHEGSHALQSVIGEENLNRQWTRAPYGKVYVRKHFIKEWADYETLFRGVEFPAHRFIEIYGTVNELEDIATFIENALDYLRGNEDSPITRVNSTDPYWIHQLGLLHGHGFFTKEQAIGIAEVVWPLLNE